MRILVFGAGGMLGTDLLQEWTSDELIPARSRETDIRDLLQVRTLVHEVRPDWIVLAAAYTDVDGSEKYPELAYAVNSKGTENVARTAQECGARLLYIGTDYVFDGRTTRPYEPDDPIAPLSIYGKSKAEGELAVRKYLADWCIVRTSWLFGASGASFPEKILRASESGSELRVVNDQVGSPTYTRDLAVAIRDLIRLDARGIVNVTNEGSCSWFEFAREILRQTGRRDVTVLPITTQEAGRRASRPAYSVLSPRSFLNMGHRTRTWQDALGAYLNELKQLGRLA